MNIKKITSKLFIVGIGVGCVLSISYVIASYSAPTSTFPDGNTSAPINVSSTDQVKDGGLSLKSLTIPTGAGLGKVLTSDASGLAKWATNNIYVLESTSSVAVAGEGTYPLPSGFNDTNTVILSVSIQSGGSWYSVSDWYSSPNTGCLYKIYGSNLTLGYCIEGFRGKPMRVTFYKFK